MYGGGGIHEYELEVLADDVSDQDTFLLDHFLTFFFNVCIFAQTFVLSPFRHRPSTRGTRHILTDGRR